MLKMSKIDQVHLWAVMLCMSKTSKIAKNLQYTQDLMLWLESRKSQLSKTFFGLKIRWILRKLWAKTCLNFFWSLWSIIHIYRHLRHLQHESNYIAFDPLLRYFTSSTSVTWIQCIRLHCERCQRFCTQTAHSGFLVI